MEQTITPLTCNDDVQEIIERMKVQQETNCCEKCGLPCEERICPSCKLKREWAYMKDHIEETLKEIGIGKRYLNCSLDNFQGGKQYVDFCREWLLNPKEGVFFTGSVGSGKTHLAVSLCQGLIWGEITSDIIFIPAIELLYRIKETFNSNNTQEIINRYSGTNFLFLDDLGMEKSTEWAIETLSLIINRRDYEELPTIITSNLSLPEIGEKLSLRISSRIANGKIIKITMPDYRKRR